jgi:hypothetical protein
MSAAIAIVFVVMLAVFLAIDVFALGMGLALLAMNPFSKGEGPAPLWTFIGSGRFVRDSGYTDF